MFRGDGGRFAPECRMQNAECRNGSPALRRFLLLAFCILPSALLLSACQQKMANQARYDPLEASDFFADGMAARPRIAGTIARGELLDDPYLETGKVNGQPGDAFPFAITAEVMDRGEERFNIYCGQCHGRAGDGNGMIPSRGYRRPPSFHTQSLRNAKTGHLYDVITNGFGSMPSYRTMIPVRDRWAIVAYVRALQLSQGASVADVPAAEQSKLSAPGAAAAPPHGGAH